MSINKFKSTTIYGELIVRDVSGNTNANTILNRDLSVTGKITTAKIVSPFNSHVNLSFLGIFPTTAVADSNAGVGFFWNRSGGQGETDLILYGQGGPGGLALFAANNSIAPYVFCKLYPSLIEFSSTPTFPTSNTVGAIGATTSYVNNVLGSYLTTATAVSTYLSQSSASSIYLTITNAASTYLSQSSASSTYLTITNAASTYLSQSSASSTYLTITNAASTYLTGTTAALTYQPITLMGNYVTGIYASATFQTISNMSNYLTTSSAASIYQTISGMGNYISSSANNTFTGTQTINNNLYLNGSFIYNGQTIPNDILPYSNISFTLINSNTYHG